MSKKSITLSPVQPLDWYSNRLYTRLANGEEQRAKRLRIALAADALYPLAPQDNPVHIANCRAALHDLVEQLDTTDLIAAYNVTRLLAMVPRQSNLFDLAQAMNQVQSLKLQA